MNKETAKILQDYLYRRRLDLEGGLVYHKDARKVELALVRKLIAELKKEFGD